ncbi:alkaline phosphatase-like protein [Calocera viscosa TUFC12733]|uniref:Alkaline phosphatase-like protein n=1 Tax=Calocera viscosa (strain TUFC12733) TaxID=1330018 RepID=A0A167LAB8_CALVF|nr:alkaline phosphatase-like protein [Calocera viscosa TUFC12733]
MARLPLLSGHVLALLLLVYLTLLHLSGLLLFTRGFLLSRLALPNIAPSTPNTTLPPTHSRAIVIIIDALRWDFLAPSPPAPPSPYHHNLAAHDPSRAFLFHSYSDPPTATLQRLKGLTTGSLPTFIDIGSNFHSTSIKEDNLILQLASSPRFGRRAFMGDDTWLSIYPDSFTPNLTSPYDSFNVEDLHTVDAGVTSTLLPLLSSQLPPGTPAESQPFQFLIAHYLGVDHVGHRLGPDHPAMRAKLLQMDSVLRQVVALLQEDTLLVLLGDHGMDPKGDHGGDSVLEVSTTTFLYSLGPALRTLPSPLPAALTPHTTYPGSPSRARSIQQIDLVPSLSLLLGLPIPFNNLGSIIPELFWRPGALESALRLNAQQVWAFLCAYRESGSGKELDDAWDGLERAYVTAKSVGRPVPSSGSTDGGEQARISINMSFAFVRQALETCRALWAQFDVVLISLGLAVLLLSCLALGGLYSSLARGRAVWEEVVRQALGAALGGAVLGGALAWGAGRALGPEAGKIGLQELVLFGASAGSALLLLLTTVLPNNLPAPTRKWDFDSLLAATVVALHAASFTSNSFILWEDHVVPFLLLTLLLPTLLRAPSAPTTHLQYRLLGFPLLLAACIRLMSISTVCREEQHPNCHVTFYASSTLPVSPQLVLLLALPSAWRVLQISKSDRGLAPLFLEYGLRASLLAGSAYWLIEQLESWRGLNPARIPGLKDIRMVLARVVLSCTLVGGYSTWALAPPCVEMRMSEPEGELDKPPRERKRQLIVLGYTNSYGSLYLLFVLVFYALTGQVVMVLFAVALLSHLETTDSVRDVEMLDMSAIAALDPTAPAPTGPQRAYPAPKMVEIVLLALLGHLLFFATGHQATAFIGFKVLTYPYSAILVVLNSVGALFLSALCVPLLAMWQVSPVLKTQEGRVYASVGCAACAAWLRRHLMVWKVFAPRFMLSGITLIVIDLGLILAVGVGSAVTSNKIRRMFGTAP